MNSFFLNALREAERSMMLAERATSPTLRHEMIVKCRQALQMADRIAKGIGKKGGNSCDFQGCHEIAIAVHVIDKKGGRLQFCPQHSATSRFPIERSG